MTTDPNQLIAAANSLQAISDPITAAQVEIALLQVIAGTSYSVQQLIALAVPYQAIGDPLTAEQVKIALLAIIVNEV